MGSTFTSALGRILENINRTSYGANEFLRNTIEAYKGNESFTPAESFRKGLKLDVKTTGSDVLNSIIGEASAEAGVPEKVLRGVLGFGIDVFSDPATYVSIGGLTKIGKLAKKVSGLTEKGIKIASESKIGKEMVGISQDALKYGSTLGDQAMRGQRAVFEMFGRSLLGKTVDTAILGLVSKAGRYAEMLPLVKGFKNLFVFNTGNKAFDIAVHKYYGRMNKLADEYIDKIKNTAEKAKSFKEKDWDLVADGMQGRVELTGTHKDVAEDLKKYLKDIAKTEIDANILGNEISSYFPAVATDEFANFMRSIRKRGSGKGLSEFEARLAYANQKILTKEMTIREANQVMNKVLGSELKVEDIKDEIIQRLSKEAKASLQEIQDEAQSAGIKMFKDKAFEKNPLTAVTSRAIASVNAVESKKFIDEVKNKFGLDKEAWDRLPAYKTRYGFEPIKSEYRKIKGIEGLEDKYFDKRIADSLERYHGAMTNYKEISSIVKGYKELINFWKRWTLSIFPEYHVRNVIGNFWNNYITAGIKEPSAYIKAAALQNKPEQYKIITEAGEELTGKQLIDEMLEYGILKSGAISKETPERASELYKGMTVNPISERNFLIRTGRAIGETLEDNAKIAHYLTQRQKGFSPDDAALSVKAALFDYSAITPFERETMRFIFPFWSWTRNNIPLQFKNLLLKPSKFTTIAKAKEEIETQAETRNVRTKWLPEWMAESFPIFLRRMPENEMFRVLLLTSWLPAGDIDRIFRPQEMILGSLEPFSKETMQLLTGKDFYLNKNIVDYPNEVENFLGLDMAPKLKHALKQIRLLNVIDQLNPMGIFGDETTNRKSFAGGTRKITDLTPTERTTKFLTGVKVYPYDVEKGKVVKISKLRGEQKRLQFKAESARKKGKYDEVKKIMEAIQKLKEEEKE